MRHNSNATPTTNAISSHLSIGIHEGRRREQCSFYVKIPSHAPVAQWIEQPPPKGQVGRSIRLRGASLHRAPFQDGSFWFCRYQPRARDDEQIAIPSKPFNKAPGLRVAASTTVAPATQHRL